MRKSIFVQTVCALVLLGILFSFPADSGSQEQISFSHGTVNAITKAENLRIPPQEAVAQLHLSEPEVPAEPTRIYGDDITGTTIAVATRLKETLGVSRFQAVIFASSLEFADSLSGSYLATVKGAPILLTDGQSTAKLKAFVRENLIPGGTVYILGGISALPATLEQDLSEFQVRRLAGRNRYETNLAILEETDTVGQEILICYGRNFPDSLSVSAVGKPILLVNKTLQDCQKEFLKSSSGKFYIIGGTDAVGIPIEEELRNYGTVKRIGGANRYETSVLVAQTFMNAPDSVVLANSQSFQDGMCAGPLAFSMGAPLILTLTDHEASAVKYVHGETITNCVVIGTSDLISDSCINEIMSDSESVDETILIDDNIPDGNPISLRVHTANAADYLGYPQAEDFGGYLDQAIALYNGIVSCEEKVYMFFPVNWDISLSREDREILAKEIIRPFKDAVSQKVLSNFYLFGFDSFSVNEHGITAMSYTDLWYTRILKVTGMTDTSIYYEANFSAGLKDGISEKDAVRRICKWISQKVEYIGTQANSAAALQTGEGSCAAYGKLFLAMCQSAGIDCRYVTGCVHTNEADHSCVAQGCHAWNRVKIGSAWYYLDVLWVDMSNGNFKTNFYLSEQLWENRTIRYSLG